MNRDNRVQMMGSPNSVMDYVKELRNGTYQPVTIVTPPSSTVLPWMGKRRNTIVFHTNCGRGPLGI